MEFVHDPVTYNEDGSVKQVLNDLWVWCTYCNPYIIIPIIPKTAGWAYTESSFDVPEPYKTVEYKRTQYYHNGWINYSRIK